MKEMLKSKVMITFVVFVLGFTFISCNAQKNDPQFSDRQVINNIEK